MKIKSIIFDSSVLINLNLPDLKDALINIVKYYVPYEKFLKKYEIFFKKFQTGLINEESFFKELFKRYGLGLKIEKEIREKHNKMRNSLVKLYPNVNAVISSLVKNYKLGILSNMPRQWLIKDAKRLGLNLSLFNSIICGSDTGVLKPDKEIYLASCKSMKTKPERCAFITNHNYEVKGARDLSLTVVGIGINDCDLCVKDINGVLDLFISEDEISKNFPEIDSP